MLTTASSDLDAVPSAPAATPARRRAGRAHRAVWALAAVLGLLVLSSCAAKDPTSYDAATQKAFLATCNAGPSESSGAVKPDAGVCDCNWRHIVKEVPFKDFKKANDNLIQHPTDPAPTQLSSIFVACAKDPSH